MRRIALVLLIATAAQGAARQPAFFDTRSAPRYGDPRPSLRAYLARDLPRAGRPQHICVVGYRYADGDRVAWAHWRERGRLILWDGTDPDYPASPLGWGRDDLARATDVVETEDEIAGSTYRVTRAWFDRVVADCAAHGTQYRLTRGRR